MKFGSIKGVVCRVVGQRVDSEGAGSAQRTKKSTITALIVAIMFTTSLWLTGPAAADDGVDTTPSTSQPADTDPAPTDPSPEVPSPVIPLPPVEAPVVPAPIVKPAPKPVPAAPVPVVKPAPKPAPAPVVKPAPATPAAEADNTQEPVEEIAEEVPAEVETTTAAPTTAAPTTVPATTRPTVASSSPSNTAQALPIESSSSNTAAPSNSLLLQLLVIGLLLAIGLAYLRFMKRGAKHLGAASMGPVK